MILHRIAQRIRGDRNSFAWELLTCKMVAFIDADVLGFHWTLWVYWWTGKKVCIAQGRTFTMLQATTCVINHRMGWKWVLERIKAPPAGLQPELNVRARICDFFKIP